MGIKCLSVGTSIVYVIKVRRIQWKLSNNLFDCSELLDFVIGFNLLGDFSFNEEELTLALMCVISSCLPLILAETIPLRLFDTILPYLEKVASSHSHESCRQLAGDLKSYLSQCVPML